MSVPKPLLLTALKVGKLYFEEIKSGEPEYESNHIYIIKIEKIQLKQLIAFTYSSLKNYNIFSEITDFDTIWNNSLDKYDCFDTYIKMKNSTTKYYFYNFDEEWFFKNKEKILSYIISYYQIKKPFLEIFQEIEMEEK
ncbi:MAG: hypothetical protein BWY04_01471 [candidate division CPR1 bacterium ADurb.Bin160]|uniref:Uncharacterized protein n=1 Tax=candidate division CPR1 bacterium ADurb.Bin160 TaxID=1852826 RepID=A0A1V5ZIU4_9BACT|nr:MAG: hypothetical protein BWY04_01471 [candidate division CPR1 bacterium ADurb.Bin160]